MEEPIKHYISMTLEILLVTIILSFVLALSAVSKNVSNTIAFEKAAQEELQEYREVYKYDDKDIKGADIPNAVLNYIRYYKFEIDNGSQLYEINTTVEKTLGDKIWTQDYIVNEVLGDSIYNNYTATLIRNTQGAIEGIKFARK